MNFKKITPSTRRLSFDSQKNFPRLMPALMAYDVLLWSPEDESLEALDVTARGPLENILAELFFPLSFMDFLTLHDELLRLDVKLDPLHLCEVFQWDWTREVEPLAGRIRSLPEVLRLWLRNRKFNASHLAPLRALNWDSDFLDQWLKVAELPSTHAEAVTVLEFLVDLKLLGRDVLPVVSSAKTTAELIDGLRGLRYPIDAEKSAALRGWVDTLPWAKRMQVRTTRNMDRAGLEIKFFTHNAEDLRKNIGSLMDVAKTLEQKRIERF